MFTLHAFGALRVESPDGPLAGPAAQRHRLALLALLAASPGHQLSRDRVLALLWPERDAHQGRTLLNSAVHTLRKVLGAEVIRSVGDALYLDPELLPSDLDRLETETREGRPGEAVACYSGPFLDGFHLPESEPFEEWMGENRSRYHHWVHDLLDQLATPAVTPDAGTRAGWTARLARHEPHSSRYAVRHMLALLDAGDRAMAVEFASAFQERLALDLGAEPDPDVATLQSQLRDVPPESTTTAAVRRAPPPTQPAVLPAPVAAPPRRRPIPAMAVGLVLVASLVGLGLGWPSGGRAPLLDSNVLLVVPFEYAGPPELGYLSEGVVDLLAARLDPGEGARVLRPRQLLSAWGGRRFRDPGERRKAAIEAARQSGAGSVLLGSLTASSGQFMLSGTLVDATTGREGKSLRGVSGPADSLLPLIDRLTTEVLLRQVPGIAERDLGFLANRGLPVVHLYLRGEAAYRRGLWDEAANHFQHALALDTSFAHAAMGLLKAENFGRNTPRWQWARNIVQAHLGQLGRAEFLMYDAFMGQPLQRRLDDWTEFVVLVPDQPEGWYALGDLQYHWGSLLGFADPQARALAHFNKALSLDSTFAPALHHVVELLAGQRQLDSLRPWARRYFAAAPPTERTTTAVAWLTAGALGDSTWIREVRANFPAFSAGELRQVVRLTQVFGMPPEDARTAVALFRDKVETPRDVKQALEEEWVLESNLGHVARADSILGEMQVRFPMAVDAYERATLSFMYGDGPESRAQTSLSTLRRRVRGGTELDRWLAICATAWWDGRHGEVGRLFAVADELMVPVLADRWQSREFGTDNEICARTIRAIAAGTTHSPDTTGALRELDRYLAEAGLDRTRRGAATLEAVRLFTAQGDHARALGAVRRRGVLQQAPFLLASQLLVHARLASRAGYRDEAIAAYRHYLALRSDPEPGALADTARAVAGELAALLTGG